MQGLLQEAAGGWYSSRQGASLVRCLLDLLEPRQDLMPGSIRNTKFQTGTSPCPWRNPSHPAYHMISTIQ